MPGNETFNIVVDYDKPFDAMRADSKVGHIVPDIKEKNWRQGIAAKGTKALAITYRKLAKGQTLGDIGKSLATEGLRGANLVELMAFMGTPKFDELLAEYSDTGAELNVVTAGPPFGNKVTAGAGRAIIWRTHGQRWVDADDICLCVVEGAATTAAAKTPPATQAAKAEAKPATAKVKPTAKAKPTAKRATANAKAKPTAKGSKPAAKAKATATTKAKTRR